MNAPAYASILAMGVRSPLGATFAETAAAYAAGERGFAKERALVGADGLAPTLAQAIPIADCRDYAERLTRLFDAAAADCAAQLGPDVGGLALRLVVPPALAGEPGAEDLRRALAERHAGLFSDITFVPGGAADALSELGQATRAVVAGEARFAAAGALDSFIHPVILDQLAANGAMLMKGVGSGVIPGEAAVIAVVGAADVARPALGRLRGVFRGVEPEDVRAPKGVVGRGLAEAFARAAGFAAPDRLIVDLDGERWRAEEFGFAVSRAGEGGIAALAADPEAPALHLGSCGTATGLLLAALALADPPPRQPTGRLAMASASSRDGGARTAAFIERAEASEPAEAA